MKKIFYILIGFVLLSCKNTDNEKVTYSVEISENVKYSDYKDKIFIKSGNFEYELDRIDIPFSRIVLLNNSLLGYFLELGVEDRIVGISSVQYVYSEKVLEKIKSGKIKNVGDEKKYDVEKIISLNPDVIFTNYIKTFDNTYDILRSKGIKIIFLDDYLEQRPLEKTAYIRLFGKLLGVEEASEKIYKNIEDNYNELRLKLKYLDNPPIVIVNEMYGNQWFMAGGKTFLANYINDAGADYILKNNKDRKSVVMSFEEVFAKSQDASIWVNIGDYSTKEEFFMKNPIYKKMKIYEKGRFYTISNRKNNLANDIFESGAVRSDLVLRDYIKIFHPEVFTSDTLVYMKELK